MKKIRLLIVIAGLTLSLCGCLGEGDSSLPTTSTTTPPTTTVTTTATTASQTTTEITTQPVESVGEYSEKVFSKDGFFSLCYYISAENPTLNEPFSVTVKLTNETNENFKVGVNSIKAPTFIAIFEAGAIWGYEGNEFDLNAEILPHQEIEQTVTKTFTEAGIYDITIFADLSRELKPYEDPSTVTMNWWNDNLASSYVNIETISVKVE